MLGSGLAQNLTAPWVGAWLEGLGALRHKPVCMDLVCDYPVRTWFVTILYAPVLRCGL